METARVETSRPCRGHRDAPGRQEDERVGWRKGGRRRREGWAGWCVATDHRASRGARGRMTPLPLRNVGVALPRLMGKDSSIVVIYTRRYYAISRARATRNSSSHPCEKKRRCLRRCISEHSFPCTLHCKRPATFRCCHGSFLAPKACCGTLWRRVCCPLWLCWDTASPCPCRCVALWGVRVRVRTFDWLMIDWLVGEMVVNSHSQR